MNEKLSISPVTFLMSLWRLLRLMPLRGEERVALVEEAPELLDEAVDAVDAVGIPGFALLQRTEEHLVEA